MVPVPRVGEAFFPLDEQLGLLGGGLTPRAEETLVRLATWMPYAQAQELLSDLVGIGVSKATGRRATLSSGQAALAVDEAEEERLKHLKEPTSNSSVPMERWCTWSGASGWKSRRLC